MRAFWMASVAGALAVGCGHATNADRPTTPSTVAEAGAVPAAPRTAVELPPEPTCPAGAQRAVVCTAPAGSPGDATYPAPFEACPTSAMFSRRETEARRQGGYALSCCQVRCEASRSGDPYN